MEWRATETITQISMETIPSHLNQIQQQQRREKEIQGTLDEPLLRVDNIIFECNLSIYLEIYMYL